MDDQETNEKQPVIDWLKELPDDPRRITFPGRYRQADREVADLIRERAATGAEIRVLDFASGFLIHGSPTAIDLANAIEGAGGQVRVTAVDAYQPENFAPADPRITYGQSLDFPEAGFDVVRVLHVMEHAEGEYPNLQRQLQRKVREGGLLIETHYTRWSSGSRYSDGQIKEHPFGQVIKVLQKVNGEFQLVAVMPDGGLGWQHAGFFSDVSQYLEFREKVARGQASLRSEPQTESFIKEVNNFTAGSDNETTASGLVNYDVTVFHSSHMDNSPQLTAGGEEFLEYLESRKAAARKYFAEPAKASPKFSLWPWKRK